MDWSIKTGNGSICSTTEDLYRWDRSLYTEKILKKSSLAQMFKRNTVGLAASGSIETL